MSFEQNIQDWVSIDNKIKRYQDAIRNERKEKNNLTEKILSYVETARYYRLYLFHKLYLFPSCRSPKYS